jgi:hypothetical protein
MEIKVYTFTTIIVASIMTLILYSNYGIKGNPFGLNKNTKVLTVTSLICIITIIYTVYSGSTNSINIDKGYLFLLGIFSIASIGYTVYEWDTIKNEDNCSLIIPTSNKFSGKDNNDSENYYIYRTMYLTTIIVLVVVLQFKVDDSTFSPFNMNKKYLHMVLFLLPFIMPVFTELATFLTNKLLGDENELKPETLLLNFIKGDSAETLTNDGDDDNYGSWLRSVMPILLYLTLMGVAILSGIGKVGTDGGKTAILLIAGFLIFFSFIMRTLFIQDCVINDGSQVGEEDTNSFTCSFEKYGGIQTMLNICLVIIIIYHVERPSYKLLFFTIIILASWGLSGTYMLNLKDDEENDEK